MPMHTQKTLSRLINIFLIISNEIKCIKDMRGLNLILWIRFANVNNRNLALTG
jgi:hypothetical protein